MLTIKREKRHRHRHRYRYRESFFPCPLPPEMKGKRKMAREKTVNNGSESRNLFESISLGWKE